MARLREAAALFVIRSLHKWLGLILGMQVLLWAGSGAFMALLDAREVSGEGAILPVAQIPSPAAPLPLAAVAERVGAPILKLQLKPLFDTYVYEATTLDAVVLLDAVDGRRIVIDAAKARTLAVARYSGDAPVRSVRRIAQPTPETRDAPLPVWRVEFADKDRNTLLVSEANGEVAGVRNDAWRLWDVAWMLHIMDYGQRQSFNHPLVITAAAAAAWLALTGLILLVRTLRP